MIDEQFEELRSFVFRLSEEHREYQMRFEALPVLLVELGVISRSSTSWR
jgi:hypothetical protein